MSKPYSKEYPNLGKVFYKRDTRIKRLSIRFSRDGNICVNIPFFVVFKTAEQFLLTNKDLLIKKRLEFDSRLKLAIITDTKTRFYEFRLVPQLKFGIKKSNNLVELYYPSNLSASSSEVQAEAKRVLEKIYRLEAKTILPKRIAKLATDNGFIFNKVTIRNTKSRWGSCSANNNISLSLHLMKLPDHLIDYIILHELCHTVEKNHGVGFWALLNNRTNGKAKELAKEVKSFSATI